MVLSHDSINLAALGHAHPFGAHVKCSDAGKLRLGWKWGYTRSAHALRYVHLDLTLKIQLVQ